MNHDSGPITERLVELAKGRTNHSELKISGIDQGNTVSILVRVRGRMT